MIREKILKDENILKFMDGKEIVKEIFVAGKIYNIVVK
jgi:leucyl-tRNA synthetase